MTEKILYLWLIYRGSLRSVIPFGTTSSQAPYRLRRRFFAPPVRSLRCSAFPDRPHSVGLRSGIPKSDPQARYQQRCQTGRPGGGGLFGTADPNRATAPAMAAKPPSAAASAREQGSSDGTSNAKSTESAVLPFPDRTECFHFRRRSRRN